MSRDANNTRNSFLKKIFCVRRGRKEWESRQQNKQQTKKLIRSWVQLVRLATPKSVVGSDKKSPATGQEESSMSCPVEVPKIYVFYTSIELPECILH
jgi:hypothetical protein